MAFAARRQVVASIGAMFASPLAFAAQPARKLVRIGWIGVSMEEPTVFELVVNMKTAKALGLAIPQAMMFRINRVIE